MGIVGQTLDAMTNVQRDRVVEGQNWAGWQEGVFVDYDDDPCKCLMGHAEDWRRVDEGDTQESNDPLSPIPHINHWCAADRFPALQAWADRRWGVGGAERIIQLCKARAAKGNRLHEIRAEIYEGHRAAGLVPFGGMSGRYPEDLP